MHRGFLSQCPYPEAYKVGAEPIPFRSSSLTERFANPSPQTQTATSIPNQYTGKHCISSSASSQTKSTTTMCRQEYIHWLCDSCDEVIYTRKVDWIDDCGNRKCKGIRKTYRERHGEMCRRCAIEAAQARQDERRGSRAAEDRHFNSAYGGY